MDNAEGTRPKGSFAITDATKYKVVPPRGASHVRRVLVLNHRETPRKSLLMSSRFRFGPHVGRLRLSTIYRAQSYLQFICLDVSTVVCVVLSPDLRKAKKKGTV